MNITKKNITFTLTEESGGYSFSGDFVLGTSGLAEFRGSVTPKAGGRMGAVYYNETGVGEVSVSFSGSQEDFSDALSVLGTFVKAAKEAVNGTEPAKSETAELSEPTAEQTETGEDSATHEDAQDGAESVAESETKDGKEE